MRAWFFAGLLPFGVLPGQSAAELHVSKVSEAPDFIGLRFTAEVPPIRLEAFLDHVMPATAQETTSVRPMSLDVQPLQGIGEVRGLALCLQR